MKKFAAILAIVAVGSLPVLVFAANSISAAPTSAQSGSEAAIMISFSSTHFQQIYLFNPAGTNIGETPLVSSDESPLSWTDLSLPTGLTAGTPYTLVLLDETGPGQHDATCGTGQTLTGCLAANSGNTATQIITITAPPAPPAKHDITVPTSVAPALTANVGDQISDPGTLKVIAIAVGIPLTFYVIHALMGLLPGRKRHKASLAKIKDLNDRSYS